MSLDNLQSVPQTENEWNIFSFALRVELTRIRQAIQEQKGVTLNEYIVDPLNPAFVKDFAGNVNRMQQDISASLGTASQDLSSVDLEDKEALSEWVNTNYEQIYTAEQALGV